MDFAYKHSRVGHYLKEGIHANAIHQMHGNTRFLPWHRISAEIDRIWAEWQTANPGQHPPLAGAAAVMDPWSETEADTRDITALGYVYV
jgi:hypothetical protein